jgi:MtN3 and saliva related transmembrane protein
MALKEIVAVAFGIGLLVNASLFVPQALRILRTKSARDVSLLTFGGFNLLQLIGVAHGWLQGDASLLLGMIASFLACGTVTVSAVVYRNR